MLFSRTFSPSATLAAGILAAQLMAGVCLPATLGHTAPGADVGLVQLAENDELLGDGEPRVGLIDSETGYAYWAARNFIKLSLNTPTPTVVGECSYSGSVSAGFLDSANGHAYIVGWTLTRFSLGEGNAPPELLDDYPLPFAPHYTVFDPATRSAFFGAISPNRIERYYIPVSGSPVYQSTLLLDPAATNIRAGLDSSTGLLYISETKTSTTRILKLLPGTGPAAPDLIEDYTLPESAYLVVVDPTTHAALFGEKNNWRIVKVALGDSKIRMVRAGASWSLSPHVAWTGVIDPSTGAALISETSHSTQKIFKISLGDSDDLPVLVNTYQFPAYEAATGYSAFNPATGSFYYGSRVSGSINDERKIVEIIPGKLQDALSRGGQVDLKRAVGPLSFPLSDSTTSRFFYIAKSSPEFIVKAAIDGPLAKPRIVAEVPLDPTLGKVLKGMIDEENGYLYYVTDSVPNRVVKVAVREADEAPEVLGAMTLDPGEHSVRTGVLHSEAGYGLLGTYEIPPRVFKFQLGTGDQLPHRVAVTQLTLSDSYLDDAGMDTSTGDALFCSNLAAPRIIKMRTGVDNQPSVRVSALNLDSSHSNPTSILMDSASRSGYFTTSPGGTIRVAFGEGDTAPSIVENVSQNFSSATPGFEAGTYFARINGGGVGRVVVPALGGQTTFPDAGLQISGSGLLSDHASKKLLVEDNYSLTSLSPTQAGFIHGTRVVLDESAVLENMKFFSHDAGGKVRFAIYNDKEPMELVWESGKVDSTNDTELNLPISEGIPASLVLSPGAYWLAWQSDSTEGVGSYTRLTFPSTAKSFCFPTAFGPAPGTISRVQAAFATGEWTQYLQYTAAPLTEGWAITGD